MARGLIADPDLPNKIRAGRDDEIRWCMRCLHCFYSQMNHGVKYCLCEPSERVRARRDIPDGRTREKKVLVVGGGTAACRRRSRGAEQGHEVILCEKKRRLGGAILCENGCAV
jgi:NADPH-dependent 2,4-dienoyl-CoA reductase/sulfur reductase-like enzyme